MFIVCMLWLVNSEKLLNYWIQNWISILYLYNPSSQFSSEVSVKYLWPLYLQYASKYNTFDHSKPMFQDVSSILDIVCHSSRNKTCWFTPTFQMTRGLVALSQMLEPLVPTRQRLLNQTIQQTETQFSLTDQSKNDGWVIQTFAGAGLEVRCEREEAGHIAELTTSYWT